MPSVILLALQLVALAEPATAPANAPSAVSAPAPATAPASNLGGVSDFGNLDLEMAIVTDFNQLDLESLLNATVETASKRGESISRAPAIIDVLTREQIYNMGARDLYTALTFLPGIEMIENYAGTTTLIFRGMIQEQYSVKLLLLINGHPISEPIMSQFQLEMVPLDAVKRIEVIRGPGSVLYGTNAFAGVINVITENDKEDGVHGNARAEAGQFTTLNGGAGTHGRQGDLNWALYAGGQHTRGFPYRVRKDQDEDCAPAHALNPDSAVLRPYDCNRPGKYAGELEYYNNYANAFADVGYAGLRLQAGFLGQKKMKYGLLPILRQNGPNRTQHVFADLSYRKDWERVGILARVGLNQDNSEWDVGHFPYEDYLETHTEEYANVYRGELTVSWKIADPITLDQGVSYDTIGENHFYFLKSDGSFHELTPSFENYRQTTASYYAQATWNVSEKWTAIGGVRASDFNTDRTDVSIYRDPAGNATPQGSVKVPNDPILIPSPRAALIYEPKESLVFKALYGEAFRLPNLFEAAGVVKMLILPSKNIQPEKIRTVELGVDSRPAEWMNLRAAAYFSTLTDLISRRISDIRDPKNTYEQDALGGPHVGGVYDNIWNGQIYGGELSSQAFVNEQWSLFGNVSYKKVIYWEIDRELPQSAGVHRFPSMAPVLFNGGFSYTPVKWLAVRPNAQYVGSRDYAKAYVLANAVIDFPITKHLTVSAVGNNLLDTHYEYPEHVRRWVETLPGGPGRALYGRVTAEF
jgi:iron complex outermembrane receptor protein